MGFSAKVKSALEQKGINASELARKTGYSPQYMHELLKGDKRWNEDSMVKVCNALGLEIIVSNRIEA